MRRFPKDPERWNGRLERLGEEIRFARTAPHVVQNEIELILVAWHGGRIYAAFALFRSGLAVQWAVLRARMGA